MWAGPDVLTMKEGRDQSGREERQGQVKAFSKSEYRL